MTNKQIIALLKKLVEELIEYSDGDINRSAIFMIETILNFDEEQQKND